MEKKINLSCLVFLVCVIYSLCFSIMSAQSQNHSDAYFEFRITPKYAKLIIDNMRIDLVDGIGRVYLSEGKHSMRVYSKGYEEQEEIMDVKKSSEMRIVNVDLCAKFGWLKLDGSGIPVGAKVYLNNRETTFEKLRRDSLELGAYTISIIRSLYHPYSEKFNIKSGETVALSPVLETEYAVTSVIVINDTTAQIWINDKKYSDCGVWEGCLDPGKYSVKVCKDGCEPSQSSIEVGKEDLGHIQTFYVDPPAPIYGDFEIISEPNGAKVKIDGEVYGETPYCGKLQVGEHELELSSVGYFTTTNLINIVADKVNAFNIEMKDIYNVTITHNMINGYEFVDLGLSVKWATCNIGAEMPYDYGEYFSWGEIEPKMFYRASNSKTNGVEIFKIGGNPEFDAARANWGGTWRMPTDKEFKELRDSCDWSRINIHGHKCFKIASRKNDKFIIMPLAGSKKDSNCHDKDARGFYWCSTVYLGKDDGLNNALIFNCGNIKSEVFWDFRYIGNSVRPVTD